MLTTSDLTTDKSEDRNDWFTQSVWHVALGLAIIASVAWGIWEVSQLIPRP